MEVLRILTNLQVEFLNELKMFCDYEDDCFNQGMSEEKLQALEEGDCFGDILFNLRNEYDVLKSYGFILFEWTGEDEYTFEINNLSITKKGEDYLTILAEDLMQQSSISETIVEAVKTVINEKGNKMCDGERNTDFKQKIKLVERIIGDASSILTLSPLVMQGYQGLKPLINMLLS